MQALLDIHCELMLTPKCVALPPKQWANKNKLLPGLVEHHTSKHKATHAACTQNW
jgi:hypothetical protein